MNDNWQQFLTQQGAVIEDGEVKHFGNAMAEKQAAIKNDHVLCDLSHYGLIRAVGEEAESFLQNQFCNDVRNVTESHGQLNAYCSPKGRVLAFFRLFKTDNQYFLRMPKSILSDTINRLRMFILMSKVTLEDASDDLVVIGYAGPEAEQRLKAVIGDIPVETDAVINNNGLTVIRISETLPRFEIYGKCDDVMALWGKLDAEALPVGSGSWELLDIRDAIPEIEPETKEAFVPQMINLQGINALSFKKGCYPGQEIVARMHYLGKLKRRMYLAHIDTDTPPAAGESLFAANSESGQGAGKVVRAQTSPTGGTDLLAVIEIASAENDSLHLENSQGPALTLEELPYEFAVNE
jgi:folate-binding protein YgfZ